MMAYKYRKYAEPGDRIDEDRDAATATLGYQAYGSVFDRFGHEDEFDPDIIDAKTSFKIERSNADV